MCMRFRLVRVWKITNASFEMHIAFQSNRFVCHCLIRLECVQSVLVFARKQKHLFEFDVFEMRLNVHAFSTKRGFLIKLTYIHPNYAIWNRTHPNKMTFWCLNSMWLEINRISTSKNNKNRLRCLTISWSKNASDEHLNNIFVKILMKTQMETSFQNVNPILCFVFVDIGVFIEVKIHLRSVRFGIANIPILFYFISLVEIAITLES